MAQPVILGRGPFLRVTGQWVSRDQAEMYADSKECTITSLGVNPSCVKRKGKRDFEQLRPNEPMRLRDGDSIALLPNGTYVFKVEISR